MAVVGHEGVKEDWDLGLGSGFGLVEMCLQLPVIA